MNNNKNFQKFVGGLKTFGNNLVSNVKQNPLSALTPKTTFMNTLAQTATAPLMKKKTVATTPVSNPSATNTTPTVIKPPASTTGSSTFQQGSPASTYMNTLSNNTYQQPAPTQTPTISPIQQPQPPKNDAYSRYVSMLRGEDETAKKYFEGSTADMKRLADIQNETEQKDTLYRRRQEDRLTQAGGTTAAANQDISVIGREANRELADLALREGAAARTANLSRSVYNDYINAGKSEYEAEQAQAEGFTLGKDQVRYDAQGNIIAGGMSGDTTGDSSGLSEWAKAINSGQAKLSDVPQEMRTGVISQLGTVASQTTSPQQQRGVDQANVALSAFDKIFSNPALNRGAANRTIAGLIPGSNSKDLKEAIGTVQALIGFNELQKMREASPTGGALGQVSEREIDFLQALAGSLKTKQSDQQLKKNLQDVQKSFQLLKLINSPDGTQGVVDSIPFVKNGDNLVYTAENGDSYRRLPDGNLESFKNVGNTRVSIPQSSRLAFVNNNPGNLRFVGQQGATKGENGFAKFSSPEAGVKALESQIKLDASRGLTLQQFINKYAPPTENNTNQYLAQMTQILGVPPTTKISNVDIKRLTQAIALKESGTRFA